MSKIHEFTLPGLSGGEIRLADHAGRVLLLVNTASACGFTPQYQQLQELHERFQAKGLSVIGFPCNQFGRQESASESEVAIFCQKNFGVSFPMSAKIDVNGSNAAPLWKFLKAQKRGVLGFSRIPWNFTKFLVDRNGRVVRRISPRVGPETLVSEIESMLAAVL